MSHNVFIFYQVRLKLGRLLRLNKIIQFLKTKDDVKASLKIFKMVFWVGDLIQIWLQFVQFLPMFDPNLAALQHTR